VRHYVVLVVNMPPTRIRCECGVEYAGPQCLDFMTEHVHALNDEADPGSMPGGSPGNDGGGGGQER
jgi:hypothetical protein